MTVTPGRGRLRQLLGDELEGLGLAGAGGARDQAVAVEHREGDADLRVGQTGPIPQQGPEVECRSCEGVPGGDRLAVTHIRPLFPFCPALRHLFQRRTPSPWLRPERHDR